MSALRPHKPPWGQQVAIVKAAMARFESSLFDIKAMAQADLFDSELDAAEALNTHGFARGAGAIAGVVLEGHLATVCANRSVSLPKKKQTLSDFYEALKAANIIDQQTWRFIQHLADIRNACDHKGSKDPSKESVADLIEGGDHNLHEGTYRKGPSCGEIKGDSLWVSFSISKPVSRPVKATVLVSDAICIWLR